VSAPDLTETIGELRELLFDIRQEAEGTMYGFFTGGDPRSFTPDDDACTEAEIATWKDDCARAERGEAVRGTPSGQVVAPGVLVCGGSYGVGVTTTTNETAKDWA
jgi:hypothetical protein